MDASQRSVKEELFSRIQSIQLTPISKKGVIASSDSKSRILRTSNSSSGPIEESISADNDEEWVVADESNPEGIISEKNFDEDTKLFQQFLSNEVIDILALKCLTSKKNVPLKYRGVIWKLLLGYLPPRPSDWVKAVTPQRIRYFEKKHKFLTEFSHYDDWDKPSKKLYQEINADVPRTFLGGFKDLCRNSRISPIISRVLYIWSSENTISYYQGMCELVFMLLITFLGEHPLVDNDIQSLRTLDTSAIEESFLNNIEADVFYSFCSIMNCFKGVFVEDVMQETFQLACEITRILDIYSPDISSHLNSMGCNTLDFSIRWIICMFVREFKVPIAMKIWDLLFSVGEYFPVYILYLSASLIISFKDDLMKLTQLSDLIMFMQKLELNYWYVKDFKVLVSRANEILEKDLKRPLEYHFSFEPTNCIKEMYKNDFIKILKALYANRTPITEDDAKVGITASLLAVTLTSAAISKK